MDINIKDSLHNDETPLIWASYNGHSEVVNLLLRHPTIDVNKGSKSGYTALHWASAMGHSEVLGMLLQHQQIDVNKQNIQNETALHLASAYGYSEIVRLLLQHLQIDVNKENYQGQTALGIASHHGHTEGHTDVTDLLLIHPAIDILQGMSMNEDHKLEKIGQLLFESSNFNCNEEFLIRVVMGKLSESCAQLEETSTLGNIDFVDKRGMSALHWASKFGHLDVVKHLLSSPKIDINKERKGDGATALKLASYNGNSEVVAILLNHTNIDFDKRTTSSGDSAVLMAALRGHEEVIHHFIMNDKVYINDVNNNGESMLFKASQNGHFNVVSKLLGYQEIDVNVATVDRVTPLMASSQQGHHNIVRSLLAHPNINANFASYAGKTALILSIPQNLNVDHIRVQKLVELLLRCPAINVKHQDENGNEASHYAAIAGFTNLIPSFDPKVHAALQKSGHTCCSDRVNDGLQIAAGEGDISMVKALLLCPKIDLNFGYKFGRTPLYLAARRGHSGLVAELLDDPRIDLNVEVNSRNALYTAAEFGHTQVVRHLLSHIEIDVNKVNRINKMSALMIAIDKGHVDIVKLLIHHSQTDVNILDARDESAISIASKRGYLRSLKLLLRCPKTNVQLFLSKNERNLNTNIKEVFNYQPGLTTLPFTCCTNIREDILRATWIGDFRAVRGILSCPQADVNIIDSKGRTPIYLASWLRHVTMIDVLLHDKQIDVNIGKNIDGSTPFAVASEKGHSEIIKKLINQMTIREDKAWAIDSWVSYSIHSKFYIEPTTTHSVNETTQERGELIEYNFVKSDLRKLSFVIIFQWK